MDPNAALRELRVLARKVNDVLPEPSDELVQMTQHFEALDEWISKGGFLPEDWDGSVIGPIKIDLSHVNPAHAQAYATGATQLVKDVRRIRTLRGVEIDLQLDEPSMWVQVIITPRCPTCDDISHALVDQRKMIRLEGGESPESLWPRSSLAEREWLTTGLHPQCWVDDRTHRDDGVY